MFGKPFYSNGKLLITAEYLILDGAKGLALPTKLGQNLIVNEITQPKLIWQSFDVKKNVWFDCVFELPKLEIIYSNNNSEISNTLQKILQEAQKLNPNFLQSKQGYSIETNLTFPNNWGLGTSSTLINNIAQWAKVDASELLQNSFGGSGYDMA